MTDSTDPLATAQHEFDEALDAAAVAYRAWTDSQPPAGAEPAEVTDADIAARHAAADAYDATTRTLHSALNRLIPIRAAAT